MSKRFAFEAVMDLTKKQADVVVAALAQLRTREQAALQTLEMLEGCRRDYQVRLAQSGQSGMGNAQWRNYQEFLSKLDKAIAQQQDALAQCRVQTQAGLDQWREARVKLKSFDVLFERHQRGEAQRAAKLEQREQDERSGTAHLRRDRQS